MALVDARMTIDSTTHSVNECHKLYARVIDNTAQLLGTEHPCLSSQTMFTVRITI
jgi:hypothetical protein